MITLGIEMLDERKYPVLGNSRHIIYYLNFHSILPGANELNIPTSVYLMNDNNMSIWQGSYC